MNEMASSSSCTQVRVLEPSNRHRAKHALLRDLTALTRAIIVGSSDGGYSPWGYVTVYWHNLTSAFGL